MYNITNGNILRDISYVVYGTQSVTYNGVTYTSGQIFRGVSNITTFTFSGSGTQLIYEILELRGGTLEFTENELDNPTFLSTTILSGFTIECFQNGGDISFNDVTVLDGFSLELLDYPFYSFSITEKRL